MPWLVAGGGCKTFICRCSQPLPTCASRAQCGTIASKDSRIGQGMNPSLVPVTTKGLCRLLALSSIQNASLLASDAAAQAKHNRECTRMFDAETGEGGGRRKSKAELTERLCRDAWRQRSSYVPCAPHSICVAMLAYACLAHSAKRYPDTP